ncbi:SET and MYND domain-containing protein 4 [Melia azedarach]|uniref:SET and MYND domain-containing protein 4 n=1 Tax=Melia azedarach TaxID=155640 RepID=A0ACC1YFG8_MELAZ|nr:SET and MYND domain-containing protein 4 [Melia azedarach]
MEKLKSLVPNNLRRMVAHSTPDDLPFASSSLLDFFLNLLQFQQIVRDLAAQESGLCVKNISAALELKQKGNQYYACGDYAHALSCYTQALRVAPSDANEMDRNLVATLYVNRASVLQKMDHLMECLRDCNRALQISASYAKAWYRRGKVNVSLKNYKDAVRDLSIAKNMELSLGGKRQIESELKIILDQYKRASNKVVQHTESNLKVSEEPVQVKLRCVTSPDKGRGMASQCDIPEATLVHIEEPYAMTILKQCRETHCHYCLNELPADAIPCTSCSIPLYCSHHCRGQAGGQFKSHPMKHNIKESHFNNLEEYIAQITLDNDFNNLEEYIAQITLDSDFYPDVEHIFEHKHECQGAHWPVVLPSDIVLAGRIVAKSIEGKRVCKDVPNLTGILVYFLSELSHSYSQIPPESKLESHIYAIVLLHCLQHSYGSELPINGASASQIVILISQIRVNSLAIVRMKSNDYGPSDQFDNNISSGSALISTVEQIRVGQAIYTAGSLYNHSCQPNIHAYFLSRTLIMRTTGFVASGCPLELSYGPQVGQWDCKDRLKFLEDEYCFRFLDNSVLNCEKQKLKNFFAIPEDSSSAPNLQVCRCSTDGIGSVANLEAKRTYLVDPGYCLKCGSYRDLASSHAAAGEAWIYIKRLQDAIFLKEISNAVLLDASRSLGQLRSIFHAYSKSIAEAEDTFAQASCLVGDLHSARDHCKASIEILEKLYGHNDIVIAYELVKLSSIQMSMGDKNSVDSITRLAAIFLRYYGTHADKTFPHLQFLRRHALKLVDEGFVLFSSE